MIISCEIQLTAHENISFNPGRFTYLGNMIYPSQKIHSRDSTKSNNLSPFELEREGLTEGIPIINEFFTSVIFPYIPKIFEKGKIDPRLIDNRLYTAEVRGYESEIFHARIQSHNKGTKIVALTERKSEFWIENHNVPVENINEFYSNEPNYYVGELYLLRS